MTTKEFKEFLGQFPDDLKLCTETNGHHSFDGITHATLIKTHLGQCLFIGNGTKADSMGYNVQGEVIIKKWEIN